MGWDAARSKEFFILSEGRRSALNVFVVVDGLDLPLSKEFFDVVEGSNSALCENSLTDPLGRDSALDLFVMDGRDSALY